MKSLKHENIIQIYDHKRKVLTDENTMKKTYLLAIMMEYAEYSVEGKLSHTLKDLIAFYETQNKILSEFDILTIMHDLSKGL